MHISTMRPCFSALMRFVPLPAFSCGMLPFLRQDNSHSVLPLRGFLWRLPHTFSAGISWWLRKHTPASLPVLPPLPGRFRLAVPAFPLRFSSGFCGLPDVPIPPALRLPPLSGRRQALSASLPLSVRLSAFRATPYAVWLFSGGVLQAVPFPPA